MTIGKWIDKWLEEGKDENQIIAVYDRNRDLEFLGKIGFSPFFYCYELKTIKKVGHEIRINE